MVGTSTTDLSFPLLLGSIPRLSTTTNLAVLAEEIQVNHLGHSWDFLNLSLKFVFRLQKVAARGRWGVQQQMIPAAKGAEDIKCG